MTTRITTKKIVKMHTVIFITGTQASGKTTVANLFRNSFEITVEQGVHGLRDRIMRDSNFHEVAVVTNQSEIGYIDKWLRNFAEGEGCKFHSLKI